MTWRTGPLDWTLPPTILNAAKTAAVHYTDGPKRSDIDAQYRGVLRTQLPITPGLQVLRDYIVHEHALRQTYMPGRSHPMVNTQRLDLHQSGRAVDFMTYDDHGKAHEIATFLIENAAEIGIQFIVCDGNRWSAGQSAENRFKAYEGTILHRDHPHVEITPEAGRMETPWFRSRQAPAHALIVASTASEPAQASDADSAPSLVTWAAAIGVATAALIGGAVLLRK